MPKSQIDRDGLLRRIERQGGSEGLDLSGHDLSGMDLGQRAIYEQLKERGLDPSTTSWVSTIDEREPRANLREIKLDDAELKFANFQGADMYRAQLGNANLARAELEGAELVWADLKGATLIAANLRGADLTRASLEGAEMTHANLHGVTWFGAFLNRTRITRQQLQPAIRDEIKAKESKAAGAFRDASDTYLLHKNNFLTLGRYEDAAWAHIKEQQMEKMACFHDWRSSLRNNWFNFLRWIRNWAFELLTGYGERAWMPVLWALAVILGFAVGYAVAGNVSPNFAGNPATAEGSHNFLDALIHSIGAFATIGFNSLEPLGWGARLLTAIESAFGIGLFALFIFTLGNRMSRS